MPTIDPAGPPADLDAAGRKLFRTLKAAIKKEDRWRDSDAHVVGQTCRHEMHARKARAGLPEDGSLTVKGSRGQDVAHPNVRIAQEAEVRFVDGLKELGLTPAARARLKIEEQREAASSGKFGGAFG